MFPAEKLRAVDCLLESFCSTRTVLNTHATRTAQLVQLYYARDGGLMGGELQVSTHPSPEKGYTSISGSIIFTKATF